MASKRGRRVSKAVKEASSEAFEVKRILNAHSVITISGNGPFPGQRDYSWHYLVRWRGKYIRDTQGNIVIDAKTGYEKWLTCDEEDETADSYESMGPGVIVNGFWESEKGRAIHQAPEVIVRYEPERPPLQMECNLCQKVVALQGLQQQHCYESHYIRLPQRYNCIHCTHVSANHSAAALHARKRHDVLHAANRVDYVFGPQCFEDAVVLPQFQHILEYCYSASHRRPASFARNRNNVEVADGAVNAMEAVLQNVVANAEDVVMRQDGHQEMDVQTESFGSGLEDSAPEDEDGDDEATTTTANNTNNGPATTCNDLTDNNIPQQSSSSGRQIKQEEDSCTTGNEEIVVISTAAKEEVVIDLTLND